MTNWLTQEEARKALGVRAETLYSYASRGRVEVCPDPSDSRRSLYSGGDIANLIKQRERRRKPDVIAASTISWGEPIIATTISTIAKGRLYYRGRDAMTLSATATLEEAAALLWGGGCAVRFPAGVHAAAPAPPHPIGVATRRGRAFAMLGALAATGHPSHGRTPAVLRDEAAGLVGAIASAFGAGTEMGVSDTRDDGGMTPLHRWLAAAWGGDAETEDLVRRALVLLADQELTTSAFAARVTVSTGASLAASALAGLAALTGPLHGDATVRVQLLFEEVERLGAENVVTRYAASGLAIPGFGHPLYPDGDPRAAALLASFEPLTSHRQMVERVASMTGFAPTIDVALAALVARCRLPADAAFSLFAIGRSVGWLAHAIEQVATGTLIRPRARYNGPPLTEEAI